MENLRENKPTEIAGLSITSFSDYLRSLTVDFVNNTKTPITLPKSNVLAFVLEGGASVVVRPSGNRKSRHILRLRDQMHKKHRRWLGSSPMPQKNCSKYNTLQTVYLVSINCIMHGDHRCYKLGFHQKLKQTHCRGKLCSPANPLVWQSTKIIEIEREANMKKLILFCA